MTDETLNARAKRAKIRALKRRAVDNPDNNASTDDTQSNKVVAVS